MRAARGWLALVVLLGLGLAAGCSGTDGEPARPSPPGADEVVDVERQACPPGGDCPEEFDVGPYEASPTCYRVRPELVGARPYGIGALEMRTIAGAEPDVLLAAKRSTRECVPGATDAGWYALVMVRTATWRPDRLVEAGCRVLELTETERARFGCDDPLPTPPIAGGPGVS